MKSYDMFWEKKVAISEGVIQYIWNWPAVGEACGDHLISATIPGREKAAWFKPAIFPLASLFCWGSWSNTKGASWDVSLALETPTIFPVCANQ